jgi:hypothetical protein
MSFNLGNWWKELTCEICTGETGGIDLDLPDDYYDPAWEDPDPFDLGDYSPEPDEPGGAFDDFDIPSFPLPGGGEATPYWDDGPGINFTWPWG